MSCRFTVTSFFCVGEGAADRMFTRCRAHHGTAFVWTTKSNVSGRRAIDAQVYSPTRWLGQHGLLVCCAAGAKSFAAPDGARQFLQREGRSRKESRTDPEDSLRARYTPKSKHTSPQAQKKKNRQDIYTPRRSQPAVLLRSTPHQL